MGVTSRRHRGWIAEQEFQDRVDEQQRAKDEAKDAITTKVEKDDPSSPSNLSELPGAEFPSAGVSAAVPSECPPVPEDVAKLAIEKDIRCSSVGVHCAAWMKFSHDTNTNKSIQAECLGKGWSTHGSRWAERAGDQGVLEHVHGG